MDISDNDKDELIELIIQASSHIITEYIGYDPYSQTYTDQLYDGTGKTKFYLKAIPITTLTDVKMGGVSVGATQIAAFNLLEDHIQDSDYYLFDKGFNNYTLTYIAGWDPETDAGKSALSVLALTCIRIGGLFYKEHGKTGILATTSLSFDVGSRTFFDFTLDKYLTEVDSFRRRVI